MPASSKSASRGCTGDVGRAAFVGSWEDEKDAPSVWMLADDGSMVIRTGDDVETGTWQFTAWAKTPRPPTRAGDENDCVLWLEPSPGLSLVYGVLGATEQTITLTYIGRGNTIVWKRSTKA